MKVEYRLRRWISDFIKLRAACPSRRSAALKSVHLFVLVVAFERQNNIAQDKYQEAGESELIEQELKKCISEWSSSGFVVRKRRAQVHMSLAQVCSGTGPGTAGTLPKTSGV